jgi:hypothetical protein
MHVLSLYVVYGVRSLACGRVVFGGCVRMHVCLGAPHYSQPQVLCAAIPVCSNHDRQEGAAARQPAAAAAGPSTAGRSTWCGWSVCCAAIAAVAACCVRKRYLGPLSARGQSFAHAEL